MSYYMRNIKVNDFVSVQFQEKEQRAIIFVYHKDKPFDFDMGEHLPYFDPTDYTDEELIKKVKLNKYVRFPIGFNPWHYTNEEWKTFK